MRRPTTLPPPIRAALLLLPAILFLSGQEGCETMQQKRQQEALRNTIACKLSGERIVILFQDGDARMLMPDAQRVVLYQIPTASGIRYSNGLYELRGKGMDLALIRDGASIALTECGPYAPPAAK
jgi:membrane-bound inhibitor of C-type lysozyme